MPGAEELKQSQCLGITWINHGSSECFTNLVVERMRKFRIWG